MCFRIFLCVAPHRPAQLRLAPPGRQAAARPAGVARQPRAPPQLCEHRPLRLLPPHRLPRRLHRAPHRHDRHRRPLQGQLPHPEEYSRLGDCGRLVWLPFNVGHFFRWGCFIFWGSMSITQLYIGSTHISDKKIS